MTLWWLTGRLNPVANDTPRALTDPLHAACRQTVPEANSFMPVNRWTLSPLFPVSTGQASARQASTSGVRVHGKAGGRRKLLLGVSSRPRPEHRHSPYPSSANQSVFYFMSVHSNVILAPGFYAANGTGVDYYAFCFFSSRYLCNFLTIFL